MDETRTPEYLRRCIEKGAKRAEVADIYATLLLDVPLTHPTYWREANQMIIERWSVSGLMWIKNRAWKIRGPEWAAEVMS